jgi:hypothetical protein
MCVCMCVYVCMYVCVCVCVRGRMGMCVCMCVHVHVSFYLRGDDGAQNRMKGLLNLGEPGSAWLLVRLVCRVEIEPCSERQPRTRIPVQGSEFDSSRERAIEREGTREREFMRESDTQLKSSRVRESCSREREREK